VNRHPELPSPEDEDRWETVDPLLFKGARLPALQAARTAFNISLEGALDVVPKRWEWLVRNHPEQFIVPIEGYWDGLVS
jgi:hypothetical protein